MTPLCLLGDWLVIKGLALKIDCMWAGNRTSVVMSGELCGNKSLPDGLQLIFVLLGREHVLTIVQKQTLVLLLHCGLRCHTFFVDFPRQPNFGLPWARLIKLASRICVALSAIIAGWAGFGT